MLFAGGRPTRFAVGDAANRPRVPVLREGDALPTPAGDVCTLSVEGDSVTTPCVSTKGGPAAWIRLDGLNEVGISTGSDGTELPVVPARSPDRLSSYGRINPPAAGTNTTLYGSMVVRV